jgi:hypothetical protein
MCDYFWGLLNKIGWCTWGTRPFAHRVIVGFLFGLHFKLTLESSIYKERTAGFLELISVLKHNNTDPQEILKQVEAYYNLYKDLYCGSAEWDSKFPVVLHRLRVLGK